MSGINKISKIVMVVSLLVASTSCVYAMEQDNQAELDELAAALALSMKSPTVETIAVEQEKTQALKKGHVFFEGSDADLFAFLEAQEALEAQERTKRAEVKNNPFIPQQNDITPEEWEIIKQQAFEAEKASNTIWTRDPGPKVSENNPQYRLRAENMPDSQKKGDPANVQTQGLGVFIQKLERDPKRDQQWMDRAVQHDMQVAQRKVLIPAQPQLTQQELDAQKALEQLNGLKKVPSPAKRLLPQTPTKEADQPKSVNSIADQFGGRGGFRKPEKK